jgi:hypothetical protein
MKWGVLCLLSLGLLVSAQPKQCLVADFYALSWIGNPSLRHEQLSRWLTTNGDSCSAEQLVVIWNRLAEWAGVADSAELRGKLLYFFAKAREREDKK